jgi:succinoglycan biosynthesis transport protein ExoP
MQETTGFSPEASSSISLREYGDVLRRRRAIILQTFVIVLVAGVLVTLFTAPTYQATARLLVTPQQFFINQVNGADPLADLFSINNQHTIATQIQLLQTPDVQKKVADKLNTPGLPAMSVSGVEGTSIIQVTAEGENPELVAQAPNTLLEIYANDIADQNGKDYTKALEFAKKMSALYKGRLDRVESELVLFKQGASVIDFKQDRDQAIGNVAQLTTAYQAAQSQSEVLESKVRASEQAIIKLPTKMMDVLSDKADPRLQGIDDQLMDLKVQRKKLEQTLNAKGATEDVPEFATLDSQIKLLTERRAQLAKDFVARFEHKNPLVQAMKDELVKNTVDAAVLAKQTEILGSQLSGAKKRLANFPSWEKRNEFLERQRDENNKLWTGFSGKLVDLELRAQTRRRNATVMTRADVPTVPIRPKKAQNIVFAGLLGLFLGLCLALLQELFDDRINSPEEAERVLRLPSLGHVPMIEEEGLRLIKDISTFSPLMESYRSLRTNINFAAVGTTVRSIVITSSVPAEGKSTTVANLAMAMALDNKRVIIVDADLRRPSQHKLFKIDSSPGLTDILVGTHDLEEVQRSTSVPGVSVIPAGSPPPNPAELLGSAAMGQLLARLETVADVVLFDSPPALAVADSVVLAARAGGVLLVVGYGETKKTNTKKALEILSRANANVLGTVLNRMDGPSSGYYYGKYYVPATDRSVGGSNTGNGSGSLSTKGNTPTGALTGSGVNDNGETKE